MAKIEKENGRYIIRGGFNLKKDYNLVEQLVKEKIKER